MSEDNPPQNNCHPRIIHQALASLLNKRAGGVEKEKDLFELPALPRKVSCQLKKNSKKYASRRMIGAATVMKVPEKMLLMLLVLGM